MAQPDPTPAADAPAILVVEDGVTEGFAIQKLLARHGYRVTLAGTGREALAALEGGAFRMVISDIDMPGMDGYELCLAIKTHPRLRTVPVILLTTLSAAENILLGLKAKADYYLTKPYAPRHLLARVQNLLEEPAAAPEPDAEGLPIVIKDRRHVVTAGRRQMLNLLLSTYESAVQQNRALLETQAELNQRNEQLRVQQEQLRQANLKLEELATQDGLTGLKNHRAFKERLEEEFQRAARYQLPFSLLLLDVDKFKQFNDTFGHPAGDEVLRGVGKLLQENTRETDFVARYGGEEFVVLMPFTNITEALALAERIRAAIESAPWPQRAITASFGVSALTRSVPSHGALVSAADTALYHSKQRGRNRVTNVADLPGG